MLLLFLFCHCPHALSGGLYFVIRSIFYFIVGLYFYFKSGYFVRYAVARLHITGWRLGAAAAFTHYFSSYHFPPPLRQTAR
jgi:hypothetical protein